MLEAIASIERWRADVHIEIANEWMYGRRSHDLDFGVKREVALFSTEDARERARRAFLTRILTGIQYEAAHPPKVPMTEAMYRAARKELTR